MITKKIIFRGFTKSRFYLGSEPIPPTRETPTDTKNPRNCINAMSLPLELIEN